MADALPADLSEGRSRRRVEAVEAGRRRAVEPQVDRAPLPPAAFGRNPRRNRAGALTDGFAKTLDQPP